MCHSHIEYFGIPISGTFQNFSQKLRELGYEINPISSQRQVGKCVFEGVFYNYKCVADVRFNPNTQIVNMVHTIISVNDQNKASDLFNQIVSVIELKYPSRYIQPFKSPTKYSKQVADIKEEIGYIVVSLEASGTDVHVILKDLAIDERFCFF